MAKCCLGIGRHIKNRLQTQKKTTNVEANRDKNPADFRGTDQFRFRWSVESMVKLKSFVAPSDAEVMRFNFFKSPWRFIRIPV